MECRKLSANPLIKLLRKKTSFTLWRNYMVVCFKYKVRKSEEYEKGKK